MYVLHQLGTCSLQRVQKGMCSCKPKTPKPRRTTSTRLQEWNDMYAGSKMFQTLKNQKVWGFIELPMDKLIHIEAEHGPEANIVVLHSHLDFFCKSWNKDTLIKESTNNLLNKHTTKTRCALRCKRRLWNKKRNICYLLIEMSFENNCRMAK